MKFDMYQYWKHAKMRDVFISANSVRFDDDGRNAILEVFWCTQGVEHWWFTVPQRLKVTPEQYTQWQPYTPMGRFKP